MCIFTREEGGRRPLARQIGRPASLGCSLTCRSSETRALYFWSGMQAGGGCGSTSYNLTRSAWSDVERGTSGGTRLSGSRGKRLRQKYRGERREGRCVQTQAAPAQRASAIRFASINACRIKLAVVWRIHATEAAIVDACRLRGDHGPTGAEVAAVVAGRGRDRCGGA